MVENIWKVPLFDLSYGESEKKAVLDVLKSNWLTSGPKIQEFENKFSEYLGGNVFSLAVSNCTSALYMSLLSCGIGPGDEVIISGLSFIAALNVVILTGATPVLADSKSLEDWNVSPFDINSKITPQTKAIIIVHFAGYPCDMDEIAAIAEDDNLILIEDAAHAVGSEYKGRKCGTLSDIACFSFFSNKNLSVGEGGMFVTRNKEFDNKARLFRSHGMTSMTIDRHHGKVTSYDVVEPGFNCRMDEIKAALGIVQLGKLDANNKKRGDLVLQYLEELANIDKIRIPWRTTPSDRTSSFHIFPILLTEKTDRNSFMDFLKVRGIQTSIHYPAFNQFSFYKHLIKEELEVAEEISRRVVTLPLFPGMSNDEVRHITNVITNYFIDSQGKI